MGSRFVRLSLLTKPWRDLRWWGLILAFSLAVCWLFLAYAQATLIVELLRVATTGLGAIGLKMLYDQHQQVRSR